MYQPPKKKSGKPGLFVLIGGGVLLIIVLFAVAKSKQPRKKPPSPRTQTVGVNLPERRKKEIYRSLFALKGMLRGAGGSSRRAYKVLADRHGLSEGVVRQIEAEGHQKRWPRSGS